VELGTTYPKQLIDHKFGRARALQAYATQRST
jgi:deoxyribodipyrimidine photolyase